MLDMSEIRKRSTLSSSSSGSYSRVSTEDDDLTDTVPTLNIHRGLKTSPAQKSVVCEYPLVFLHIFHVFYVQQTHSIRL